MNREIIQQVRDNIANVPESAFSMVYLIASPAVQENTNVYWSEVKGRTYAELGVEDGDAPCGTVMCIAGRTCAMFAPRTEIDESCRVAQSLMGLSRTQADHLYLADFDIFLLKDHAPTKEQALQVLDTFMETGLISWAAAGAWDGFDRDDEGEPYEYE